MLDVRSSDVGEDGLEVGFGVVRSLLPVFVNYAFGVYRVFPCTRVVVLRLYDVERHFVLLMQEAVELIQLKWVVGHVLGFGIIV